MVVKMDRGFLIDIVTLERKYSDNNDSIPAAYINRISKVINGLTAKEKVDCQLYIEKFKKLRERNKPDISHIKEKTTELREYILLGDDIVRYLTHDELWEKLECVMEEVDTHYKQCDGNERKKLEESIEVVNIAFKRLLPALIAWDHCHGGKLASHDEYIM